MVVGVSGLVMTATLYLNHKSVCTQQLDERITSGHAAGGLKQPSDDDIQLGASEAGIILAVVFRFLDNQRLYGVFRKVIVIRSVVE